MDVEAPGGVSRNV